MYLINLIGVWTFDFDGMRGKLGIERQGIVQVLVDKFGVDFPLREYSGSLQSRVARTPVIIRTYLGNSQYVLKIKRGKIYLL